MEAEWVAVSIRARLLARHRLGRAQTRELAHTASWADGIELLAASSYGRRLPDRPDPSGADRAIAAETVWNLRVLAGWGPTASTRMLRVLAAGFEIENIEQHLLSPHGATPRAPHPLGPLSTAWTRVRDAPTAGAVREVLAASAWGDPGTDRPDLLPPFLTMRWAGRLVEGVPDAGSWAAGLATLVIARERFTTGRSLGPWSRGAPRQLGMGWPTARSVTELRDLLSPQGAWVLQDVDGPEDLWLAEARWWRRLEADGQRNLAESRPGPAVVAAAAVLLLVDAWRTRAALAALAGGPLAREAFDAAA